MAPVTPKFRPTTRRGLKPSATSTKTAVDAPHKEVKVGGEKNGSTRLVPAVKGSRYYATDDIIAPKRSKKVQGQASLRSTITPGTVLILLAGRFRGKRVVFLKQLDSGLLLVTGPYKINGVPLRRVNQAYVIATSTKVDLSAFTLDEKINDAYFAKDKAAKQSAEAEFFSEGKPKEKAAFPETKSNDQKEVDKAIVEAVKKTENLSKYLKASWGLSKGQFAHQIVF